MLVLHELKQEGKNKSTPQKSVKSDGANTIIESYKQGVNLKEFQKLIAHGVLLPR